MNKPVKLTKCKNCRVPFEKKSSFACCSMACGLDYLDKAKVKKLAKAHTIQKKEFLDNDKQFQKAKAQKSFNEFIRLRDSHLGCVSCDKPKDWHGQWHCGHYKTVGARPDLRFNEDNAAKQCSKCNNYLSGNLTNYRVELINRIGKERLIALDLVDETKKYTAQDYKNIHLEYQQKIKDLKNVSPQTALPPM